MDNVVSALYATHTFVTPHDSPKRPIKPTRKLGRIAHQQTPIPEPTINQFPLDRFDPPVHHIARRHAVRSRFSISERNLGDTLGGRWRVDGAVGVQETAVAVRGIFTETDVGCDVE